MFSDALNNFDKWEQKFIVNFVNFHLEFSEFDDLGTIDEVLGNRVDL